MNVYSLSIITPQELFLEGDVVSLCAPGGAGCLGVLAHHAPLIITLNAGLLDVTTPDGAKKAYQIGPGFLDVQDNKAILLTTSIQSIAS